MKYKFRHQAFTLIELLTVLAVIAALLSILLPVLVSVKKTARAVMCQANIRSTGLAFMAYSQFNKGYLPPAYTYIGGALNNQPAEPINGIRHWSGAFIEDHYLTEETVHCPDIRHGGLPPQNTQASNLDPDQPAGLDGVIDDQAKRCAFTVNEALCARNRFVRGFEETQKPSRLVKEGLVGQLSRTILLTEWPTDGQIVAGADSTLSKSYMPVHGFRGLGKMVGSDRYDLNMLATDSAKPCSIYGNFRRIDADDLSDNPTGYRSNPPRLDWVGRNHKGTETSRNLKRSSFFYMDGHTELKSVYDTVDKNRFEWGVKFYSLTGRDTTPCY